MTSSQPLALSGRQARRRRRFAKTWTMMDETVDQQVRAPKVRLLPGLPSELVEVGPGRGSSFPYMRPGTRVTAYEPNRWFHDELASVAAEHEVELDLRGEEFGPGSLELESHDAVLSCLTLCSVADVPGTLAEVERGLKPGGQLTFIEHVAADGGIQALYQKVFRGPWRAIGDGCDPRSGFLRHLEESALVIEEMTLERFGSNLDPTNLVAWGTARKP